MEFLLVYAVTGAITLGGVWIIDRARVRAARERREAYRIYFEERR